MTEPPPDIFDTIERLRREARPFCIATVVRTADATSAKAGAKAAVTRSGEILGHLGGHCVVRALRVSAAEALAERRARLIRVRPAAAAEAAPPDIRVFQSGCPSGGTVEILVEPWCPPPALLVLGETPIAAAIRAHGRLAGFRVDPCAPADLAADDVLVIAAQGEGDAAKLRTALESGAGRIAMIASARKAAALRRRLVGEGVAEREFDRVKAPAGLDLGGVDPHEIAISVLAEIVLWRNRARRAAAEEAPARA